MPPSAEEPGPTAAVHAAAGWGAALRRRGFALLLGTLAVCTGTLAYSAVDVARLALRVPGLSALELAHAGLFAGGLNSMLGLLLGLGLGLVLLVLTRGRDLAHSAEAAARWLARQVRPRNRSPEAAAWTYALLLWFGLVLGAAYKLNVTFFSAFKNQQLAALVLACLLPLLLGVTFVAAMVLRVGLSRLTALLARVPLLRVLATVYGAMALAGVLAAGGTVFLVVRYRPIVRIIDWRPLSYPSLLLGTTLVVLGLALWSRSRRLARGRAPGKLRRAALAGWALLFVGLWVHCFLLLGHFAVVRTALLRQGYGVSRTFDTLSGLLDFDGDGYLSFFGGGDCAPFDAAVNPGAIEIPSNGVDDNCFGGDLNTKALQPRKRRFDFPRPPALAGKKPNLVLITLDGLRADHLGSYGYKRNTSPNIDRLARQSTIFERAYAQAPSTRYSIPSFHTSKYSSQVPRENTLTIPRTILPAALLMAEVFKDQGYRTGAALSYQVFARSWGLDQGFDFYDNSQAAYYVGKGSPTWNKDQKYLLVDVAKKFLAEEQDKPFLLWVHFFEPHPPFVHRSEPHDFGTDMVGVYDGEIRFGDARVGELLEALKQHPAADRTVIAISADHGRGLGEHGMATHGYDLFNENLHVPLIFHVPGTKPRRIKNPVGLIDILPTFVNLAGLEEEYDFEGETLLPQITRGKEPPPDRPIFSEVQVGFQNSHVINSIVTRDYKLIYDLTYNTFQLFDMRSDPEEKHNLVDKRPEELERVKGKLYQVMERATLPMIQEKIRSSVLNKAPPTPGIKQVNFADQLQFLGFEVQPPKPSAGQIMHIVWYVKALDKIKRDNKFIVQLKGKSGDFFDAKHVPVEGLYPTSKWQKGEIIMDRQHMRLPARPQEWEVWVGFGTGHDILKPVDKSVKVVNTVVKVGSFSTF